MSSLPRRTTPEGVIFEGAVGLAGRGTVSFCAVDASVWDIGANRTLPCVRGEVSTTIAGSFDDAGCGDPIPEISIPVSVALNSDGNRSSTFEQSFLACSCL